MDRMLLGITTPTMALLGVVGATMQGAHRHPGITIIIHLVVLGRPPVSVTLRLLSTTLMGTKVSQGVFEIVECLKEKTAKLTRRGRD